MAEDVSETAEPTKQEDEQIQQPSEESPDDVRSTSACSLPWRIAKPVAIILQRRRTLLCIAKQITLRLHVTLQMRPKPRRMLPLSQTPRCSFAHFLLLLFATISIQGTGILICCYLQHCAGC